MNTQQSFQEKEPGNQTGQFDMNQTAETDERFEIDPNADDGGNSNVSSASKEEDKRNNKKLKRAGLIFLGLAVLVFLLKPAAHVDKSEAAEEALRTHVSSVLSIGTILASKDEAFDGSDYTVTHSLKEDTSQIYLWDYAAEDGDYVQIFADGVAIGEPFMIKNKPVSVTVPSVGEIKVVGTKDGGGGITYAVHYEVTGVTYFNAVGEGEGNCYTLIRSE